MSSVNIDSAAQIKQAVPSGAIEAEPEDTETQMQKGDLKGQKVAIYQKSPDSFKQAMAAAEAGGIFRGVRADQKRAKKQQRGKKKSDSKKEGEKTADARVGGVGEVEAVEALKRDKKRKDPFFKYRRLDKQKKELLEEKSKAKAKKLTELENKINSITKEMEELYNKNKMIIDSGTAINKTVKLETKALQQKGVVIDEYDIQLSYRDAVLDYGNLKDTYFKLMETYKEDNLHDGIRITISALARDLNRIEKQNITYENKNINMAIDKDRLRIIMQELYKMKNLHTFYEKSESKFSKYVSEKVSMSHLMGKCLELMEKSWADSYDVTALSQEIGVKESDPKVLSFLNDLLALLKSVPNENVYSSGTYSTEEIQNAINEKRESGAKEENKIAAPHKRA